MAKLLQTSTFLLLAAFLLIAEANHHNDRKKLHKHEDHDDHDDDGDDSDDEAKGAVLLSKGLLPKFKTGNLGGKAVDSGKGVDGGKVVDGEKGVDSSNGGCKCNDTKFREFINKFVVMYRAYASKELAPELKAMIGKMVDFIMNYLAKEKPNEISKVHNFLQSSAKVTGGAITQAVGS